MRHYLENHKFYVLNEDSKLVYKVGEYETYHDSEGIHIHLELVAGWDYVNPDENDVQGWCPADRFVEDVQWDMVFQYFLVEENQEATFNGEKVRAMTDYENNLWNQDRLMMHIDLWGNVAVDEEFDMDWHMENCL